MREMKEYSKYVNLLIQAQALRFNESIEEIIYENLTTINVKYYIQRVIGKDLTEDNVETFGVMIKEIFRCNDEFDGKLEDKNNKAWVFDAFLNCFEIESYKDISTEFFEIYKDFVVELPDYVEQYYQERILNA